MGTTQSRNLTWTLLVAAGLLLLLGLGAFATRADGGDPVVRVTADPIIGGVDLSTWKTYSNQISVVEVVAERQGALGANLPERFVDRRLTLSIERNLYEAPEADSLVPESTELTISTPGWWEKVDEGTLTPVIVGNDVRMEVGQRYLVAFAYDGLWWPMNSEAVVAIGEDQMLILPTKYVDREPVLGPGEGLPAGVELASLTIDQAEVVISTTDIDPFATAFMSLPLHVRISQTFKARTAAE